MKNLYSFKLEFNCDPEWTQRNMKWEYHKFKTLHICDKMKCLQQLIYSNYEMSMVLLTILSLVLPHLIIVAFYQNTQCQYTLYYLYPVSRLHLKQKAKTSSKKECYEYDTKLYLMVRL